MLTNLSSSIFTGANSVEMVPVVSAEWNQNLFNPPYLTVAGTGAPQTVGIHTGYTESSTVTGTYAKANFTTKSFTTSVTGSNPPTGSIAYDITGSGSPAYKIVIYVMTDSAIPTIITGYAKGTNAFGSNTIEANSYGWTKLETYVGAISSDVSVTSLLYTINASGLSASSYASNPVIYYTKPEVYLTTFFDYQYNSMWPTRSVFSFFRPGESYVQTGDINYSFPANYRKINTSVISGYAGTTYSPVSPVMQNPKLAFATIPVPVFKNVLPSDMNPYKYFVSDTVSAGNPSISGLYEQNIISNKIVIKFNTLITTPTIQVAIDGTTLTVDGSTSISMATSGQNPLNGVLTLYWNGSAWTKSEWSTMPKFTSTGSISTYTSFKKITVTQISKTINSDFSSLTNATLTNASTGDATRMHLVELSPRLEIDLSDFVIDFNVNKSLDSKDNLLPISSINSNDASISLAGMPINNNNTLVSLFSNQSNLSTSVLSNMLRKNIKFYINANVKSYSQTGSGYTAVNSGAGTYVPVGVFYSDTWSEQDVDTVSIQCFDITRYLQTTPVPDYVANLKTVFDIICNMLDLAGFTDYDYDSLYSVCNDKSAPTDLFYFFCNSKDTTIVGALVDIFLAYQIGAYIDEYGVMKFLSLSNILAPSSSSVTINDSSIVQGGYSITSKAKPGKVSLRYQTPKINQSLALQNATNPDVKNGPSFIYTTKNDVTWSQQNVDSVGFNYLNADMLEKANALKLNVNDALDIFHSYTLNSNGYAAIENEIVSFLYKEYTISNGTSSVTVSVKNDIELNSEVNKFIKKYAATLTTATGDETSIPTSYNVTITPTGYISNVQRGMFGSVPSDHTIISSLAQKNLAQATCSSSYGLTLGGVNAYLNSNKVKITSPSNTKVLLYPSNDTDLGGTKSYGTYSTKFDLIDQNVASVGLFFNLNSTTSMSGAYFVELIKVNRIDPKTGSVYTTPNYQYAIVIYTVSGTTETMIAWADVSGIANKIISNFPKVPVNNNTTPTTYSFTTDQAFQLKAVHWPSESGDGEQTGELISVFLNNFEIQGWNVAATANSGLNVNWPWTSTALNLKSKSRQKPLLSSTQNPISAGSTYGAYMSSKPTSLLSSSNGFNIPANSTSSIGTIREIYATQKPLKERSVNYYFQDRNFLNGMIQGQNVFSLSKSYIVQTVPEVIGINTYDVQYTTPAAVNVDVYWGGYLWKYVPGSKPIDQQYIQSQLVDEYSVAMSTPINTGFRAKMAIANNSGYMVFLQHQTDQINQFTSVLNLTTHEIIAPSDPEIIERIVDSANSSEVAQLDSVWIQSKEAAYKAMAVIEKGLDGFSRDVSLEVFGNPLIQVGDVITLTYTLVGINQQQYLVHSVSQSFSSGLSTKLVLNRISTGVAY